MDRFNELNAFIAVVEAGGFTAAARRTGDSQSAISKAIGALERRLGVVLFNRSTRSVSIGFELETRFWGQGLMREALSSIVDHAYDRWDINRIQATTDLDNHASIGLLRSLGFIEEGIMRQLGTGKTHFTTFVFFP